MNQQIPQQVTSRYVRNIISRGRTDDFELVSVMQSIAVNDGIIVGYYYDVVLKKPLPDKTVQRASGTTPSQAVQRALVKFGVTFR